jgi:hypothetical protein
MRSNSTEQCGDLATAEKEERDSRQINALIEQLNRDLEETQKNASKRR